MKSPKHVWYLPFLLLLAIMTGSTGSTQQVRPASMHPPVEDGVWLRPAEDAPAEPVIGFKDGIRIALWPAVGGPRGIIRICTPYVFPGSDRQLINFIAIEPIVGGHRGLSELEMSALDQAHGKRLWFSDNVSEDPEPVYSWKSSRGRLGKIRVGGKEIETLSIVINCEKFDNGAHPIVQATFRADRPYEVAFKTFAAKDSAPMESCVLTATMGNFARCRLLWLKDEVVDSRKVWPTYDGPDFVGTPDYPIQRLRAEKDGTLIAAITPSEKDPASVKFEPKWWAFHGVPATQYWRKYPADSKPDLRVRVNGRATFYGTDVHLPGGIAFENFEMIEPFSPGSEVCFGVTLQTPEQMGWHSEPRP